MSKNAWMEMISVHAFFTRMVLPDEEPTKDARDGHMFLKKCQYSIKFVVYHVRQEKKLMVK